MQRPLIAASTHWYLGPAFPGEEAWVLNAQCTSYAEALDRAGAAPMWIPVSISDEAALRLLHAADGLLLPGGIADVAPRRYGKEPLPGLSATDVDADRVEILLAREAVARPMPVLAICRGMQVLNVALGGTLHQDLSRLPGILKHRHESSKPSVCHRIRLEPGSRIAAIAGQTEWWVNSYHHQAVDAIAPGLRATARASDGIAEALELEAEAGREEDSFLMAVQFHAEEMAEFDPAVRRLFEAFVDAARLQRDRIAKVREPDQGPAYSTSESDTLRSP
jgi:putative glutamine amidotransferase